MGMYTLLYLKWITNKDLLHVELCSKLFVSLDGRGVWGRMNTRMCLAEFLPPYSPETVTTLSVSCTLTQNRKFKKKKKAISCCS